MGRALTPPHLWPTLTWAGPVPGRAMCLCNRMGAQGCCSPGSDVRWPSAEAQEPLLHPDAEATLPGPWPAPPWLCQAPPRPLGSRERVSPGAQAC